MKKVVFTHAALLLSVAALLTGCAKNEIEPDGNSLSPPVALIATASTYAEPETRMGYEDDTIARQMRFTWQNVSQADPETFSVMVQGGGGVTSPFTLRGGDGTNNGTFEGAVTGAAGSELYAIYPKLAFDPILQIRVPLDLSTQTLATTTAQLKHNKSNYMWAKATYSGSGNAVDFQFQHQVALLKVTMILPAGTGNITELKLGGIQTQAVLDATTGVLTGVDTGTDISVMTPADAGGIAPTGNTLTAYIFLFPQDLSSKYLTLTVTSASGIRYVVHFKGRQMEAGRVYPLSQTLTQSAPPVVGAFHLKGGFLLSKDLTSLTDAQKNACDGIVFEVNRDGTTGKIVSLDEQMAMWNLGPFTIFTTSNLDGRVNMASVDLFIKSVGLPWDAFPAFKWVAGKNDKAAGGWDAATDRWYLPALEELRVLCGNFSSDARIAVDTSLRKISASQLSVNDYWSSTQFDRTDVWSVNFGSGSIIKSDKLSETITARAVATF